jgi:hypothetical protein
MSNHGKESTNREGVNIDETQTKIDMGKLITPMKHLDWKTPIELFDGGKPKVGHIHLFSCGVYIFIPKEKCKNKLSPKTELMTFISYAQGNYLFMRHEVCYTTFSSPTAIFDEMFFPFCSDNRKKQVLTEDSSSDNTSLPKPSTLPQPAGLSPLASLNKESSNNRFIFPYAQEDDQSSLFPLTEITKHESSLFSDLSYKDIKPEEQPQEVYSPEMNHYQLTPPLQTPSDSQIEDVLPPPRTPSPAPSSYIPPQS